MPSPEDTIVGGVVQRVVDDPGDRVLEDRYTDFDNPGGGGGGGVAVATPVIQPPYVPRVDPGFTMAPANHPLAIALGVLSRQKRFSHLRFAIADLTTDAGRPTYVGYQDNVQTFIASTAKIAVLLPAFALRERARLASQLITAKDKDDFFKQLGKLWASEFRRFNRAGKEVRNSPPALSRILALSRAKDTDSFSIDFTRQDDPDWKKRGFHQRMMFTLNFSDNDAASTVIGDLGFPYIFGIHKTAGLFDKRGIFVNLDYTKQPWDPAFTGSGQAGTARTIAELLTLVVQDRLVGPGLAREMLELIAGSSDLVAGIAKRLPEAERPLLKAHGKIGYSDGVFGDCSIVRRKSPKGANLVYVAVAFGGTSHDEIKEAGAALDDCVLLGNLEAVKPPVPIP